MMNSPLEHSPAPWAYDDNREGHEGMVNVYDADGRFLLCMGDMESSTWQDMCDASLIAAAPDLLEACKFVLASYTVRPSYISPQTFEMVRAAIAKAYAVTTPPEQTPPHGLLMGSKEERMGYSIRITTDREIPLEDAEAIVAELPESLQSLIPGMGISRQSWGWRAATDISLPEGNEWRISGSYNTSGWLMANAIAIRLRLRGYTATIGAMIW